MPVLPRLVQLNHPPAIESLVAGAVPVNRISYLPCEFKLVLHPAGLPPAKQAEALAAMVAENNRLTLLSALLPSFFETTETVAFSAAGLGVVSLADGLERLSASGAAPAAVFQTFGPKAADPQVTFGMPIKRLPSLSWTDRASAAQTEPLS